MTPHSLPTFIATQPLNLFTHRRSSYHGQPLSSTTKSPLLIRIYPHLLLPISCSATPPSSHPNPTPSPPPLHYFVTYQTWRNPIWLQNRPLEPYIVPSSHARPLFRLPAKNPVLKIAASATLIALVALLSLSYVRLNSFAHRTLQTIVHQGLSRELRIGRVARCNPLTGITLTDVRLDPSAQQPTAPVISAKQVTVSLSGYLRALVLRKPLRLDVRLDDATVKVSQIVVDGVKGLPVGQWDPGIDAILANANSSQPFDVRAFAKLLRFVQPGTVVLRSADVYLCPADFLDYGHRDEVVQVEDANAEMTFPVFSFEEGGDLKMDGEFRATVNGAPVDGGVIAVECEMSGNKLATVKPEEPIVGLRVFGEGVQARRVASFLSLPFRADEGVCGADISMEFLYRSKSLVPLMRGEAKLEGVGLRFHPDPKTPEFRGIDGKLRFEGKTLFLDGPGGNLGTLPMTVVGSIHLEDGYSLMGYVRPVDVNEIIETFDVEKFVPVEGLVSGEVQMSGILEEPIVTGWAESVTENNMFDRLPLKSANLAFEWDAIAGILKFPEIHTAVKGGGSVSGSGSLFFDMTKESPYGISQMAHSPRSPKAAYWNPSPVPAGYLLPPEPEDEMEIDEKAPFRPYDSMRFDFKVTDVRGGDLLYYYGGEYGKMATNSIGLISGEAILAGHAKDANCRAVWRSTTPPPPVRLGTWNEKGGDGNADENIDSDTAREKFENAKIPLRDDDMSEEEDEKAGDMLGGGDFKGLVYIKLGDLPDSRRLKARTTVQNFDARRAGWSDPRMRKALANAPLLEVSADTYFKGTTAQRPLLPPGMTKIPRTPRMELLGADGALAVKNLKINSVKFDGVMSGSFSFSTSDFSLSLREVNSGSSNSNGQLRGTEAGTDTDLELNGLNELTVAASLRGEGNMCFRLNDSEIVASITKDERRHQIASVFARNVVIEDFVGDDRYFSSGETLGGLLNMNMKLDLTSQRGDGVLKVLRPQIGPMNFSSVNGDLTWRDRNLILERGVIKYRESEYQLDARYVSKGSKDSEFEWKVNINIPRASISDVARLIQSGNAVATAMQSSGDKISGSRIPYSRGPVWLQRLSESSGLHAKKGLTQWQVPENLSFADQVKWFNQYLEDERNIKRLTRAKSLERAILNSSSTEISGDISGRLTVKYNSQSGEGRRMPTNASAVLQALLDQLARSTFSFQLGGSGWRLGPALLDRVEASGTFEDGVLLVGPLSLRGKDGFGAEAEGRITSSGWMKGSAVLRNAPAALVNQFSRAPVDVTGDCNARVEVEGNLSNPRAFGRAVWTDATLNGKQVRGAKTDMACVNGRCILNVNAKIGGRGSASDEEDDEAGIRSLQWGKSVTSGLKDLAAQASNRTEAPESVKAKTERRGSGEAVLVRVSAPVRFYLLKYLQRRAPTAFWSAVKPVLGGSLPSDDEWVLVDVDVEKYGLVLLNTVLPELGWESGDSDIRLRVSGTLADPAVKGVITVSDGRASPGVLGDSITGLRGEIGFHEKGLLRLKSVSARCGGKGLNMNGDLFFSEAHRQRLLAEKFGTESVLERLQRGSSRGRKERRRLQQNLGDIRWVLQRGNKGVSVEFGEVDLNLQDRVVTKLSGKLNVNGTCINPVVAGGVTLSEGLISVGSFNGVGNNGGNGQMGLGGRLKGMEGSVLPEVVGGSRGAITRANVQRNTVGGANAGTDSGAGANVSADADSSLNSEETVKSNADSDSDVENGFNRDDEDEEEQESKEDEEGEEGEVFESGIDVEEAKAKEINSRVENGEVRRLADGFGGVRLDKLRVTLGREMQVVQPFVLDFETQGSVILDGMGTDTTVNGEIRVVRGSVNMLATRMYVRRDVRNYIRFTGKQDSGDAVVRMTLEDGEVMAVIGECEISKWSDHVVVTDKSGDEWSQKKWGAVIESNLESVVSSREKVARLVAGYVVKNVAGGGKIGGLEWKVFPALLNGGDSVMEGKLKDELGVGGEFEVGGLAIVGKRALNGSVGGGLRLRGKWGTAELDMQGGRISSGIEIQVPRGWIRKDNKRS
eukprot:GFKZ01014277.1.p1 GENE.GFKZ01014277.1~~GFKZ01014277.1.p1  ORF type:complete len:2034 (+),score=303.86 GFKZ01014277.1:303-6404(+)